MVSVMILGAMCQWDHIVSIVPLGFVISQTEVLLFVKDKGTAS